MEDYNQQENSTLGEQLKRIVNKLLNDEEIWKEIEIDKGNYFKGDEIKMWITADEIAKCQVEFDLPAAVIWDLVLYPEEQTKWDAFCMEGRVIEELDVNNDIIYHQRVMTVPSIPIDVVLYRYNIFTADQSEFLLCYRSVESDKAPLRKGFHRVDVRPSATHVKKHPKNPMKCIVTLMLDGNVAQANAKVNFEILDSTPHLTNVSYTLAVASNLKRYLQFPRDHFGRHIYHIADRTCKEMADLFADWPDINGKNWKKVTKEPNISIWAKQLHDRDILCNTGLYVSWFLLTLGVFELNMRPRDAFNILMDGVEDPFQSSNEVIEVINELHHIRHISWKSTTSSENHDSVVLHCGRVSLDGLHMVAMRSVVHTKAPVSPDARRIEILPSGYFIHPMKGGNSSLIVYCVQVDVKHLSSTPNARANAEKMFTLRALALRSALRKLRPRQIEQISKPLNSKVALISTLCSMFLEHSERRQLLSLQLKVLTSQTDLCTHPNSRKRKETEETPITEDSPNDDVEQLPPIRSILSSSISNAVNYRKRAFTVSMIKNSEQNISINIAPCYISMLPEELVIHFFRFLDLRSIANISVVCKKFFRISEDPSIWKNTFVTRFPNSKISSETNLNWKVAYRRRVVACNNWKSGKCTTQVIKGHNKAVRNVAISDDYLLSGSSDRQVRIWNPHTGEPKGVITGPKAGVIALRMEENIAEVGYGNGCMVRYDLSTRTIISEKQYSFSSKGFCFLGDIFLSWDETIDVWDITTGKLLKSLAEHKRVSNIEVWNKKYLASGGSDKLVKKWDLETGTCLNTFIGHSAGINAVDLDENFVVSCGNDRLVKLWDSRSNECVANYVGHVAPVKCVRLSENWILSGGSDNTVRIWDKYPSFPHEVDNLFRLKANDSPIHCLVFNDFKAVCGDNDGGVVIYHFDK